MNRQFEEPKEFHSFDISMVITHFEQASQRANQLVTDDSFTPRYTFYSEKTGVVRSSFFNNLDISMQGIAIADIISSGPFWIDVCQPTGSELNEISRVFGIHPLTNEDIQTPDTREKCEVFQKYFYVVMKTFEQNQFKPTFLQPIPVDIVIFEECILSFSQFKIAHSKNVRTRIDNLIVYGQHVTTGTPN
jgi:Mg2+ and Co2+ transporter CorA